MMTWTLDEAVDVIRKIQPIVRALDYHCVLGGGVLNKGFSTKDLDLFFLKLNGSTGERYHELFIYLGQIFGTLEPIRDSPDYIAGEPWHYREMIYGLYMGKRVDIFIQ